MDDVEIKKLLKEKVINQHFVSNFYLQIWRKNGRLFCLRDNKIIELKANTSSVAAKKLFYKVEKITDNVIKLLYYRYSKYLELYEVFFGDLEFLKFMSEYDSKYPDTINRMDDFEKLQELCKVNFLEKKYSKMENKIAMLLGTINSTEYLSQELLTNIFSDCNNECYILLFLYSQYFRTINFYNIMEKELCSVWYGKTQLSPEEKASFIKLSLYAEAIKNTFLAIQNGFKLEFIFNSTKVDFLTSDHPVFSDVVQGKIILSAPISPKLLIRLRQPENKVKMSKKIKFECIHSVSRIKKFNKILINKKNNIYFSTSKEQLHQIIQVMSPR